MISAVRIVGQELQRIAIYIAPFFGRANRLQMVLAQNRQNCDIELSPHWLASAYYSNIFQIYSSYIRSPQW